MQVEEIFMCGKNERKTGEFPYSMAITISPAAGSVANRNAGFALVH